MSASAQRERISKKGQLRAALPQRNVVRAPRQVRGVVRKRFRVFLRGEEAET